MTLARLARVAIAFLAAVAATAVLGSVLQTQINIAAIESIGPAVPLGLRAATTAEDMLGFGPVMAAIAGAAMAPAFLVAGVFVWLADRSPTILFSLAGVLGLFAAFGLMGHFTPMPTLVGAVRGPFGLAAMCATGLVGGLVFSRLATKPSG
ncbi:hypothetical protein [Chenggangzhangella methanolivorans]|uniref:Major facilitator superfamily (MFS) profile domain-containing protein n=1 Tax=Chenggangzhangella methanolivorans TaxID=1437009 RepID=A0A9E6UHN3_9HYPH|nr:hypothetical protein [Chenggangzhangella methanolivorans]QZN99942.1 hypothetical protein K6K41_25520 [Chenggangzhangella methanolivorans]